MQFMTIIGIVLGVLLVIGLFILFSFGSSLGDQEAIESIRTFRKEMNEEFDGLRATVQAWGEYRRQRWEDYWREYYGLY